MEVKSSKHWIGPPILKGELRDRVILWSKRWDFNVLLDAYLSGLQLRLLNLIHTLYTQSKMESSIDQVAAKCGKQLGKSRFLTLSLGSIAHLKLNLLSLRFIRTQTHSSAAS